MILRQIYSENYVPNFIRIAQVYRKYYEKYFVLFFRTQYIYFIKTLIDFQAVKEFSKSVNI